MKSQVAKRININLTSREIEEIAYIKEIKTGEKYITSDIIRDAIKMYAEALGYPDDLPF